MMCEVLGAMSCGTFSQACAVAMSFSAFDLSVAVTLETSLTFQSMSLFRHLPPVNCLHNDISARPFPWHARQTSSVWRSVVAVEQFVDSNSGERRRGIPCALYVCPSLVTAAGTVGLQVSVR